MNEPIIFSDDALEYQKYFGTAHMLVAENMDHQAIVNILRITYPNADSVSLDKAAWDAREHFE